MAFDSFKDSLSNMKNRPSMYIKLGLGNLTYENITAIFKKQSDTNGYILYNTEQMTVPKYLRNLLDIVYITKPVEIWDYSLANIDILKEHGIYNTKFVPLVSSPKLLSRLHSYRTAIDYDVGFCGGLSPRRNYIFNKLKENRIKVNVITNYGIERDKKLAKCRILINIHFSNEYKIFESARCEPWLRLGVPIISEKSIIDDPRCIVTDYDNLVNMTIQYLNYLKSDNV
jgi:hypothetical protein